MGCGCITSEPYRDGAFAYCAACIEDRGVTPGLSAGSGFIPRNVAGRALRDAGEFDLATFLAEDSPF